MIKMFEYAESFNGDISEWNVSNVRDMSKMFEYAESFGDISEWNVSNVRDMVICLNMQNLLMGTFQNGTSNVTEMSSMF